MNALRRTSAVALLALLALFAGTSRSLAFTPDDLAGQWLFQFKFGSVPAFQNGLDLYADGSVIRSENSLYQGTFAVSGTAFTLDYSGGTHLQGTVSTDGTTISGTATQDPVYGDGTFFASKQGGGTPGGIAVEQPEGTRLTSGSSTVDFGNGFTVGTRPAIAKVKFIVKNTGQNPLTISDAAVSSGPFRVTAKPAKKVAPGKSCSLTVQMTPNDPIRLDGNPPAATMEEGKLLIFSDDATTPVFRIKLKGQTGGFNPQGP